MKKIVSVEIECDEENVEEIENILLRACKEIEDYRLGDELGVEIKDSVE